MIEWTQEESKMIDDIYALNHELFYNREMKFSEEDLLYFTEVYEETVDKSKNQLIDFLDTLWFAYICVRTPSEQFFIDNLPRFKMINWEHIIEKTGYKGLEKILKKKKML